MNWEVLSLSGKYSKRPKLHRPYRFLPYKGRETDRDADYVSKSNWKRATARGTGKVFKKMAFNVTYTLTLCCGSAYHLDADPGPTFYCDAGLDPESDPA